MIIRVESNGIKNDMNGAVTHFRILVDEKEIVQHHVVHRTDDNEHDTSFFGVTSVLPGDHKIVVEAKVYQGTTRFFGNGGQSIHGKVFQIKFNSYLVLLFSQKDAKYLTFNNDPIPYSSLFYSIYPLNLQLFMSVSDDENVFVMGSISRVQQNTTIQPKNSIYRLIVGENTVSQTNTGTDHRDDLRRSVLMTGIANITHAGEHVVSLEVCKFVFPFLYCTLV